MALHPKSRSDFLEIADLTPSEILSQSEAIGRLTSADEISSRKKAATQYTTASSIQIIHDISNTV